MNIAPHVARGGCCIRIRKVGRYLACRCTNGYKATSDITRTGAIQERDQMRSTCTEFSVRTWNATGELAEGLVLQSHDVSPVGKVTPA